MQQTDPIPDGPALGLIELCSTARGLITCDAMVKRAPVRIARAGSTHPGKYTILIRGGVDEVDEALRAGLAIASEALVDQVFLPYPHAELDQVLAGPLDPPLEAVGILEAYSVAATIRAADATLKAAEVRALRIRLADHLGGKGHFLFTGLLHDAEAGLKAGREAIGKGLLAGCELIARPHADLVTAIAGC
ncbi:MAG: BMC domain-containing protein [Myxococcales bacterium]|nr:BMC domain-containing protein [Myxococcales bacterium]